MEFSHSGSPISLPQFVVGVFGLFFMLKTVLSKDKPCRIA